MTLTVELRALGPTQNSLSCAKTYWKQILIFLSSLGYVPKLWWWPCHATLPLWHSITTIYWTWLTDVGQSSLANVTWAVLAVKPWWNGQGEVTVSNLKGRQYNWLCNLQPFSWKRNYQMKEEVPLCPSPEFLMTEASGPVFKPWNFCFHQVPRNLDCNIFRCFGVRAGLPCFHSSNVMQTSYYNKSFWAI